MQKLQFFGVTMFFISGALGDNYNYTINLVCVSFKARHKLFLTGVSNQVLNDTITTLLQLTPSNNLSNSNCSDHWTVVNNDELYFKWTQLDPIEIIEDVPRFLPAVRTPVQAKFTTCIFYTVGAFWVGIIAGNVCLIKRILYSVKARKKAADQATQYELSTLVNSTVVFKRPSKQASPTSTPNLLHSSLKN